MLTNVVAPDKLGGLERYVRELADTLAARGATVSVIAKVGRDGVPGVERVDDRLTIVRYRPPSKRNPFFGPLYPVKISLAVRAALRASGAGPAAVRRGDVVVHGHFPLPMIPVLLAGLPFVYTMHAPVYKELLGERQQSYALPAPVQRAAVAVLATLEAAIVRRARRLITLSGFVEGEATALARRPVRTVRIPGGIDVDRFSPGSGEDRPGTPVLFSARRFVERTGVELLVQAMARIVRELPDSHLYIAGDGPRRAAVETLIEELGLGGSVTLLGRVSDEDLLLWYRSADLCITPTLYLEGFGLSTAEALACGKVAVVTPAGANSELVEPLDPVLLAETVSAEALARAVVGSSRLVGDEAFAARARASIAPSMGWPSVAAQHEALYREVGGGLRTSR